VYQVKGDAHTIEGSRETRGVENVAGHNLHTAMPRATEKSRWVPDKTPDAFAILEQAGHKPSTYVSGSSRDENQGQSIAIAAMT
jgi:hypothetical protein